MENRKFTDSIKEVITSPIGLSIEIFGLMIYRLENNSYTVSCERNKNESKDFKNVDRAIEYFFELRAKYKLGFDYESK